MVIFIYIISLIPNLIFFSKGLVIYRLVGFTGFFLINMFIIYGRLDVTMIRIFLMEMKNMRMGFSRLVMGNYNFVSYVFLGVLLLLILIRVVKICYYCDGPLRVFKYKYA